MLAFPKAEKLRVAPVPRKGALLTASPSRQPERWQGRDEEQGFSGPNKEHGIRCRTLYPCFCVCDNTLNCVSLFHHRQKDTP